MTRHGGGSRMPWLALAAGVAGLITVLAGCGAPGTTSPSEPGGTSAAAELPQGDEPVDLDPATFTADVDHAFWPMEPGRRWTYVEVDEDGREVRVVVTVTSETRTVAAGIEARVVRDTVTSDGEVVEDTFDWYAQDLDGSVWYLGEDTAELEDGEVVSTEGAWEAGVDGALAGVILPAEPADGMTYRQEYYAGEAEDVGEVLAVGEVVGVPHGQVEGALVTRDTSAVDPSVVEYKFYGPRLGPVLALDVSGGSGREELVAVETVDAEAARAAGTTPLGEPYP